MSGMLLDALGALQVTRDIGESQFLRTDQLYRWSLEHSIVLFTDEPAVSCSSRNLIGSNRLPSIFDCFVNNVMDILGTY
jgi:hypothetical protein